MTDLITSINGIWKDVAPQVKAIATALAGIILIFYVFKAFIGDEQDTRQAIKNIKRVIVIWLILVVAPSLYEFIRDAIGG